MPTYGGDGLDKAVPQQAMAFANNSPHRVEIRGVATSEKPAFEKGFLHSETNYYTALQDSGTLPV